MSAKSDQTIQEKMKKLEELADWFESDEVDIDEALNKYEEAMLLAADLENEIKSAKNKFTKIKKSFEK